MKIFKSLSGASSLSRTRVKTAYTLPEMFISMTLFLILILGIVSATLFGLRWFQINQTKLLATNSARQAIGKMTDEIRSCNSTYIGNITTNGIFMGLTNGDPQIGSSLLIYPTTNQTNYILYFRNAGDQTFRRTSIASGRTTIVAQTVTNADVFLAQDFLGNVQTNNDNNRIIRCSLKFYQAAPYTPVPTAYTLNIAVARRAL